MQSAHLRRREFITLLGGVAAWPPAARAQQKERIRRIGALLYPAANDPTGEASIAAFRQGLQRLGWNEGRNTSASSCAGAVAIFPSAVGAASVDHLGHGHRDGPADRAREMAVM